MPRSALVGDNGRLIDLDLEGDDFYNQFADALLLPTNGEGDDDELSAAWRGSWPRQHGTPPADLRLAVGVLVVQALSTMTAADELTDDPISNEFGRSFGDFAQEFVHDLARGADLLSKWQARAFQQAVANGMADWACAHLENSARKRRRITRNGADAAAGDSADSASAAAASPAASRDGSSSGGDSSDDSDNSNSSSGNVTNPAVLERVADALADTARDGSDMGAALDAQAALDAVRDAQAALDNAA